MRSEANVVTFRSLAWAELRLGFGHVFRKFDLEPKGKLPDQLVWRDVFLPFYHEDHLQAHMQPVSV